MKALNIGQAARAAGITPKMIRHYEAEGLLPPPRRSEAGYRVYGDQELAMLSFIRHARELDFPISEIRALLLAWQGDQDSLGEVVPQMRRRIAEVEAQQKRLRETGERLAALVHDAEPAHAGDCPILRRLATQGGTPAPEARSPEQTLLRGAPRRPAEARARPRESARAPAHAALSAWLRGLPGAGATA